MYSISSKKSQKRTTLYFQAQDICEKFHKGTSSIVASGDLIKWESIGVATDLGAGNFQFEATASPAAVRFYKVIVQ